MDRNFISKMQLQKSKMMANEIDKIFTLSKIVKEAIAKTERELFVPSGFKNVAYQLDALPLSSNQWISSPLTVAKMTEALKVDRSVDSVLEIGCGSGYQAAVLSKIFRRVFTIERIEKLVMESKQRFKKLNISNIHLKFDDGQKGWKEFSPFDRIIFSASIKSVPMQLLEQLNDGGILVAPVEKGDKQIITQFKREKNSILKYELDSCYFVQTKYGTQK